MRLFLAIYPPEEWKAYFRDVIREFDKEKRNLKGVDLENLQLTVRFVGGRVSEASKQIIAAEFLKRAGNFTQPSLEIADLFLGFPRQKYPKVMFAELRDDPELDQLVDEVHSVIRGCKRKDTILWKPKKDMHYHITFGRLKDAAVTRSTIRRFQEILGEIQLAKPEPFRPEKMYLVRSELQRNKAPQYRKMEEIRL